MGTRAPQTRVAGLEFETAESQCRSEGCRRTDDGPPRVKENRAAYADQWVAVEGDRLIAADADPLKVFTAAKAQGIRSPFVVHLLAEDPLPFVPGW